MRDIEVREDGGLWVALYYDRPIPKITPAKDGTPGSIRNKKDAEWVRRLMDKEPSE